MFLILLSSFIKGKHRFYFRVGIERSDQS